MPTAYDQTYEAFDIRGLIIGNGAAKLPPPYPFCAVMSVIYDSVTASAYHAPLAAGPNETQGFDGGNNFWSFSLYTGGSNEYSIGCEGTDALSGVGGITGRWTRNFMAVRGVGQNLSWHWDLPSLSAVITKNLANPITFHATNSQIMLGSTPWINNENIDGGIDGTKMWSGIVLPLWAAIIESWYREPVLSRYFPYLWSCPDLRAPQRSHIAPVLPTHVAVGTIASGTTTIAPALPGSIATGDILVLFCESANQAVSISNQAGGTWSQASNSGNGTGTAGSTGATRLTVFWSRYNGTQTAPTVADPGNHVIGRMYAVRGCIETGDPFHATNGGTEGTSDTSGSISGLTTTIPNCFILSAISTDFDPGANGTAEFSSFANGDLASVTERIDNVRTDGNGGGIGMCSGTKAAAGTIGATTVTHANAGVKSFWMGALAPAQITTATRIFKDRFGIGKNFIPNPAYPTSGLRPGAPYLKTWKGKESLEDLLRSVSRNASLAASVPPDFFKNPMAHLLVR